MEKKSLSTSPELSLLGNVTSSPPLLSFIYAHSCSPAPARPNTTPLFKLIDVSRLPLTNSPSPFVVSAWNLLLQPYPGSLRSYITTSLQYGVLLGYNGPEAFIISKSLSSAALDPGALTEKLQDDLLLGRVVETPASAPYICSPLGLVPKHDGGLRRTHHLSHPPSLSVNDHIPQEAVQLKYTSLSEIENLAIKAGRGCTIIKKRCKGCLPQYPSCTTAPMAPWLSMGWTILQRNMPPFRPCNSIIPL